MRWMPAAIGLSLLFLWQPGTSSASGSLQNLIDSVPAGGSLLVEEGVYEESITLNKPITLKSNGSVIIKSCEGGPVIKIAGALVTMKNMTVEQCASQQGMPAIMISGNGHHLEDINVTTQSGGIYLDQAQKVEISGGTISGTKNGNGIDLWNSNLNIISNMDIKNTHDGIYLEKSHQNEISQNSASGTRYGFHLMFSNGNVLKENLATGNTTGSMVMSASRTQIHANIFIENNQNVHSNGLLLYDAYDTDIRENDFDRNRVGIFMENASSTRAISNVLRQNYIGVQFKNAANNLVSQNILTGNVIGAQAVGSAANELMGNDWDSAAKLDAAGNGYSSIPYRADPFLLGLTEEVPAYQLFFQAPGMAVLQTLLKSPPEAVMVDETPLMRSETEPEETASSPASWAGALAMLFASLTIWMKGRKRQ